MKALARAALVKTMAVSLKQHETKSDVIKHLINQTKLKDRIPKEDFTSQQCNANCTNQHCNRTVS